MCATHLAQSIAVVHVTCSSLLHAEHRCSAAIFLLAPQFVDLHQGGEGGSYTAVHGDGCQAEFVPVMIFEALHLLWAPGKRVQVGLHGVVCMGFSRGHGSL